MLYLIESFVTQGLLFFMNLAQTLYYSFGKWEHTSKEIVVEEEVILWGYKSLQTTPIKEEPIVYESSLISPEQESFFESMFKAAASTPEMVDSSESQTIIRQDVTNDMLTMDCWEEPDTPVTFAPKLSSKADARINDNRLGEQVWVVEVVGEEQGYLHVSDGSARAWVDAVAFNHIGKGDILTILVDRNEQFHVSAKEIDILQKKSLDFAIEEQLFDSYDEHYESKVS